MRKTVFSAFRAVTRPLLGKRLGRIGVLRRAYDSIGTRLLVNPDDAVDLGLGFRLKVHLARGLDGIASAILTRKEYEPVTTGVMRRLLQPGMTAVDVGACIGYYTLLMSTLVGDSGRVLAFEPEDANFKTLSENVRINARHNVTLVRKAVSDSPGSGTLFVSTSESGEHSLVRGRVESPVLVTVETTTIDEATGRYVPGQVDLIKIDTEGNEVNVLLGAAKTLMGNPQHINLIIEFWPTGLEKAGHTPAQLWHLLEAVWGFRYIYVIDEVRREIAREPLDETVRRCAKNRFSVNLLCTREDCNIR